MSKSEPKAAPAGGEQKRAAAVAAAAAAPTCPLLQLPENCGRAAAAVAGLGRRPWLGLGAGQEGAARCCRGHGFHVLSHERLAAAGPASGGERGERCRPLGASLLLRQHQAVDAQAARRWGLASCRVERTCRQELSQERWLGLLAACCLSCVQGTAARYAGAARQPATRVLRDARGASQQAPQLQVSIGSAQAPDRRISWLCTACNHPGIRRLKRPPPSERPSWQPSETPSLDPTQRLSSQHRSPPPWL